MIKIKEVIINSINIILLFFIKKIFIHLYSHEYTNAVNNSNSALSKTLTLDKIFDIFITDFSRIYKEKGLIGLRNYSNYINQAINNIKISYEWAMVNSKWNDQKLSTEVKNIEIISKIFKSIKITGTIFTFIQAIISFITKAALIPFYVLAVYTFFKKLLLLFSFIFSSSIATVYFSNDYKFFNIILHNVLALKELSRIFWLKSYNYIFNENLPLYKIEEIIEEIKPESTETNFTSYFSWLDLSFITTIDYSFTSHPYIYSAIVGITTIGVVSTFYYNPSLVSDSSNFIWEKSKSAGKFLFAYFINKDDDGNNTDSNNTNSDNTDIIIEDNQTNDRSEKTKARIFAKVDTLSAENIEYEKRLKDQELTLVEKEMVNTGLWRYINPDHQAWNQSSSSSSGSITPKAPRTPILTNYNPEEFHGHIDPLAKNNPVTDQEYSDSLPSRKTRR